MMPDQKQELLRTLPAITELLKSETAAGWLRQHPQPLVAECLRRALAELRQQILDGEASGTGVSPVSFGTAHLPATETHRQDARATTNSILALAALAAQKEVIVSRGQLIEIGGSFRPPEVMAQSGARLVEVGATNRTHLKDYQKAITTDTAAIMRVHPSNYRVVGFTSEVPLAELAELAHSRGLTLIDDLGAGALLGLEQFGLPHEPTVRESIAAGADVVLFSGDKLIGAGGNRLADS